MNLFETRHRMMMAGIKDLFVFIPGTPLQNYSDIKRRNIGGETWNDASKYIKYGENNENVLFPTPEQPVGAIYRIAIPLKRGYTKLFVKASSHLSGGEVSRKNAYIGWSTNPGGEKDNRVLLDDKEKEFEFNISGRDKSSGMFYLFLTTARWTNLKIVVSDIHFE
jgi:hypothetical protein